MYVDGKNLNFPTCDQVSACSSLIHPISDLTRPARPFDEDEIPLDRLIVPSGSFDTRPAVYSGLPYTDGQRRLLNESRQLIGSQRPAQYFTREGGQYLKRQAIITARVNYPEIFLLELIVLKLIEQSNLIRFNSLRTHGTCDYSILASASSTSAGRMLGCPRFHCGTSM